MSKKMKKLPLGKSDFKQIIEGDYCYVDKTLFIKEVLDKGDAIMLVPRPRRFGKTLNLSMLRYFYDCCPETGTQGAKKEPPSPERGAKSKGASNSYKTLFANLAISRAGSEYLDKMGKYPVIFLTFKDVKELTWETCLFKLKELIREEYSRHDYLLENPKMKPYERDYFQEVLDINGHIGDYENSLGKLLIFLNRYYGQRVVILIDAYDAPVHAGFSHGYYDEVINFIRNFLCGGLKDTDQYLEKGVITGIMRIAKESIFSGLNNPGVYTLLSKEKRGQAKIREVRKVGS